MVVHYLFTSVIMLIFVIKLYHESFLGKIRSYRSIAQKQTIFPIIGQHANPRFLIMMFTNVIIKNLLEITAAKLSNVTTTKKDKDYVATKITASTTRLLKQS